MKNEQTPSQSRQSQKAAPLAFAKGGKPDQQATSQTQDRKWSEVEAKKGTPKGNAQPQQHGRQGQQQGSASNKDHSIAKEKEDETARIGKDDPRRKQGHERFPPDQLPRDQLATDKNRAGFNIQEEDEEDMDERLRGNNTSKSRNPEPVH